MHKCLLCHQTQNLVEFHRNEKGLIFWKCLDCGFIFKHLQDHLSPEAEKSRYELHQNNVQDLEYQNFLMPVIEAVTRCQLKTHQGLDYGCGPSSAISYLLKQKGFVVAEFDPYFHPHQELLKVSYDYITCTEVIEHMSHPAVEFKKLRNLLKPQGRLYIKTSLTDEIKNFGNWYYQRDPTHVGFFNQSSLEYIKNKFGFLKLEIFEKYLVFETS